MQWLGRVYTYSYVIGSIFADYRAFFQVPVYPLDYRFSFQRSKNWLGGYPQISENLFWLPELLGWSQPNPTLYANLNLNPRLAGGGGVWTPPPSGFSRIAKKRRRAAPPGFHPPYPPSFPQLLWKFRPKAMWGQVTRSGQVTQLQNTFPIAPRLQCFRESYETFGIWWGHQCLQNVYLGFLISVTSGQVIFATSPLYVNGQKINSVRYIYFGASVFEWNHIV